MLKDCGVEAMKAFARKLDLSRMLTRKSELETALEKEMRLNLGRIVIRLSEIERKVLAQAVHNGGVVARNSFEAMHGIPMPDLDPWNYRRSDTSLLLLLGESSSGCFRVPDPLLDPLKRLVPEPPKPAILGLETIPETHHPAKKSWREASPRPVHIFNSREIAPLELRSVLQLVRSGKLSVTDKSLRPTEATTRRISQSLVVPDFDVEDPKASSRSFRVESPGSIRAHAWGIVIQQCGWAKVRRGLLALTEAGQRLLQGWTPDGFKEGMDGLVEDDQFDEFSRVNHIRGQSGRGRRYLSDPSERRSAILNSVAQWPVDRWIAFDEAWRFLLASGNGFILTSQAVTLYFSEQQYGHLGGQENVLPRVYLRAFLMETLATLGIIDIAFSYPHNLWPDLEGWGTDELDFCSRYDGLFYVRLNSLGAYCLDVLPQYEPTPAPTIAPWEVLGNGEIIPSENLSPPDTHLMEGWAHRDTRGAWWLDAGKVLDHVISGGTVADISGFLEGKCLNALPEALQGWLSGIAARASSVKVIEQALLIEMREAASAEAIARDPDTGPLCLRAGEKHLAVAKKHLRAFRKALKKLGFALPEGEMQA